MNLSVALKIVEIVKRNPAFTDRLTKSNVQRGVSQTRWPGRLQSIDIHLNKQKTLPILLDGAHNAQASSELGKYLTDHLRPQSPATDNSLIFIIGMTRGKALTHSLFANIIRPGDTVILTKFKPNIEGMPWIKSYDPFVLAKSVEEVIVDDENKDKKDSVVVREELEDALQLAWELSHGGEKSKVVVCGSLYLAADVLRLDLANR
ncbi:unnamed protein product [Ambrosiozyma monospora]|uniref:Unnamed protein product n=1 Tax=Ambrosiozyma monospora TaxID=43982 RepID=A0ACB5T5K8_AMBMO|nr:unnamed protein product [Ambrosiozyma monospora]